MNVSNLTIFWREASIRARTNPRAVWPATAALFTRAQERASSLARLQRYEWAEGFCSNQPGARKVEGSGTLRSCHAKRRAETREFDKL